MAKRGLYIFLFDGHAAEQIEGCGCNGPVFGPLDSVELRCGRLIRMHRADDNKDLKISEKGLIYYNGSYFETVAVLFESQSKSILAGYVAPKPDH